VWNGKDCCVIASVLQYLHWPNGKVIETSGRRWCRRHDPLHLAATGPSRRPPSADRRCAIIAFIEIRPGARGLGLALGTLALGVLWMVGGAGGGQRARPFLNFIGLARITFGIGARVRAQRAGRRLSRGPQHSPHAVLSTGAAVALCSLTHDHRLRVRC